MFNVIITDFTGKVEIFLSLIKGVSEFNVISSFDDRTALYNYVKKNQHSLNNRLDMLLFDGSCFDQYDSQETLKEMWKIKSLIPSCGIIFISEFLNDEDIFNALKHGASGLLLKSSSYLEMFDSLRLMGRGGAPLSPEIARKIVNHFGRNFTSPLSYRETEVLELLSKGYTFSKIAENFLITTETVKTHVRHIYDKLDVRSKMEALNVAKANRLIQQ
jgi:DNA-binding NarL/FixJ family response regulator